MNVEFWDTAGAERFQSLTPSYIRDADIICVVCDRTEVTESQIYEWMKIVEQRCNPDQTIISLLLNKHDLLVPSSVLAIDSNKICNTFKRNGWNMTTSVTSIALPHLFKNHIEQRLKEVSSRTNQITKRPTINIRKNKKAQNGICC